MFTARMRGREAGQMAGTTNHNEQSEVTGIIGNMARATSGFLMRKHFSENYLQFGHTFSSILPPQSQWSLKNFCCNGRKYISLSGSQIKTLPRASKKSRVDPGYVTTLRSVFLGKLPNIFVKDNKMVPVSSFVTDIALFLTFKICCMHILKYFRSLSWSHFYFLKL